MKILSTLALLFVLFSTSLFAQNSISLKFSDYKVIWEEDFELEFKVSGYYTSYEGPVYYAQEGGLIPATSVTVLSNGNRLAIFTEGKKSFYGEEFDCGEMLYSSKISISMSESTRENSNGFYVFFHLGQETLTLFIKDVKILRNLETALESASLIDEEDRW